MICADMVYADVAQLAEQLICNQQVAGSIPVTSSKEKNAETHCFGVLLLSACVAVCDLGTIWVLRPKKREKSNLPASLIAGPPGAFFMPVSSG